MLDQLVDKDFIAHRYKSESVDAVQDSSDKISNNRMLLMITVLFALFVISEIIGASVSGSLSLLGDAAAMSVDVISYFANMWAEGKKEKNSGALDLKTKYILHIYIPLFSLVCLFAVTIWITVEAIRTIISPPEDGDDLNVAFLYGFAVANFLIDLVSSYLFYIKWKTVFKEPIVKHLSVSLLDKITGVDGNNPKSNINMMSAFTHVGGDTFRTCSVFVCALIISFTDYNSELCDAWASLAVTFSICLLAVPLINEIFKSFKLLRSEVSNV